MILKVKYWHCLKALRFITAEIAEGAEFKTVPIHTPGISGVSAFSARYAVKLEDINSDFTEKFESGLIITLFHWLHRITTQRDTTLS